MNGQRQHVMKQCHDLTLIPEGRVRRFVQVDGRVMMSYLGNMMPGKEVPGTLNEVTEIEENGQVVTTLTYQRVMRGMDDFSELSALKSSNLVAVYKTATGERVVAGTKDYPMKITFQISNSVANVTLVTKGVDMPGRLL